MESILYQKGQVFNIYIRSILQSDREIDKDIIYKIQVGWMKWKNVSKVIYDRKICNKFKEKFDRTVIRPIILHSSECWFLKD